ncbi:unnamed protein product [Cochlearia groenlandica]
MSDLHRRNKSDPQSFRGDQIQSTSSFPSDSGSGIGNSHDLPPSGYGNINNNRGKNNNRGNKNKGKKNKGGGNGNGGNSGNGGNGNGGNSGNGNSGIFDGSWKLIIDMIVCIRR